MELRHLKYFLAVARHEHFGRAAEELHMASPPLSRTIRQLEHDLGAELFTRSTREVKLTPAGLLLQQEASALLDSLTDTTERVRQVGAGALGVVRLGVTGAASYGVLPTIARIIKNQLPGVGLKIQTEMLTPDQTSALLEDRLDIGVLRPPLPTPGISTHPISDEPLVLALPSNHRLAGDPDVTVADLQHEPFITYDPRSGSVVDAAVLRTCARYGFTPQREHQVYETSTLLALVAAGLGVALVPASATALSLHGVTFTEVPDTEHVGLALAWRSTDTPPLVESVIAALKDNPALTAGQLHTYNSKGNTHE